MQCSAVQKIFRCVLSVRPSIRNAFVSNTRKRVISATEVEGISRGGRRRKKGWGLPHWGGGDEGTGEGVTRRWERG